MVAGFAEVIEREAALVAGPATHRKRHSLILTYRFELIRQIAA
jgi:hypothetical protein